MILKFIKKYANELLPILTILSLFLDLSLLSTFTKVNSSSTSIIFFTFVCNISLLITLRYCISRDFLNTRMKHDWHFLIPILIFISVRSLFFDSIPRWDSSEYFNALITTINNFDLTPKYFVNYFNWFGHLSLGFSFITSIGQMINPTSLLSLNITNILIGSVGVFSFYKICEYFFGTKNKLENLLLSLAFSINPLYIAVSMGYIPDFSVLVFLLIFLASFLNRKLILSTFFAILLIFAKETGALVYGVFFITFLITNLKTITSRDVKKKLVSLIVPLFILFIYFVYKEWNFWAPDGTSFLTIQKGCRFCFGIIPFNIYQNLGAFFLLNFNWIFSFVILLGVYKGLVIKIKSYQLIESKDNSNILKILNLCFLALVSFFTVFVIYVMPRYTTLGIPLLYLAFYVHFRNVFGNEKIRKIILSFLVILLLLQVFFTVDPVSKHFFGTYKIGEHKVLKVGTEFLGDGFIYNTQHIYIDRLLAEFIKKYNIDSKDNIYIEPYAWGEFYTKWGHFIGKDPNIYFSLDNPEELPDNMYYISFPFRHYTPEEKTKIQNAYVAPFEDPGYILDRLGKIYKISVPERININNYWVDVYKLEKLL